MPNNRAPESRIVLNQTEDGRTRIQCRFENATIWLTQALLGELFQKDVRTINEHLVNIFEDGQLSREATIRKFRMVRSEQVRQDRNPALSEAFKGGEQIAPPLGLVVAAAGAA